MLFLFIALVFVYATVTFFGNLFTGDHLMHMFSSDDVAK